MPSIILTTRSFSVLDVEKSVLEGRCQSFFMEMKEGQKNVPHFLFAISIRLLVVELKLACRRDVGENT